EVTDEELLAVPSDRRVLAADGGVDQPQVRLASTTDDENALAQGHELSGTGAALHIEEGRRLTTRSEGCRGGGRIRSHPALTGDLLARERRGRAGRLHGLAAPGHVGDGGAGRLGGGPDDQAGA